jgi:uncharacterized protein
MRWHTPGHAPAAGRQRQGERPVVVGLGPCGLFTALALAQMGLRPIVLERGKPVRERTRDTWGLWRKRVLNPREQCAVWRGRRRHCSPTASSTARSRTRAILGRKVMHEFVEAGAPADILYAGAPAHRHLQAGQGGRAHARANHRAGRRDPLPATGVRRAAGPPAGGAAAHGLQVQDLDTGEHHTLHTRHAVMALGHSSRDTFAMLHDAGVFLEAKPFSVGLRIEHPQSVIDRARWGRHAGHPLLGAADYKLVHHAKNGRAVYSFCMCPGGTVVAATSEPGRVVTNGMSQYSRNERNANAGMVVGIEPATFRFPQDTAAVDKPPLASKTAQRYAARSPGLGRTTALTPTRWPASCCSASSKPGPTKWAAAPTKPPASWWATFWRSGRPRPGEVLPSYRPGVKLGDLAEALPAYAIEAMREALPVFGRKIKGYDMADAVLTGVETRTSSPLRITRGADHQSLNTAGLYPAGEGASYAGGILSAGVDGIKVAEALARDAFWA